MTTKGRIQPTFDVLCGGCSNWLDVNERTITDAKKVLLTGGWKNYPVQGWCCPACVHRATCIVCQAGRYCHVDREIRREVWGA